MAYFHCLIGGGSSGGGYELTVTCDADFAGTTITCTDGVTTLTQTCPSSSPYEVVFEIPNGGDWMISGVVSGHTVSTGVSIPTSAELIATIQQTVTIYSAKEDTISYVDIDGATQTITFASSESSKQVAIEIELEGSSITFTSGVAKDPSNLSNYYSKTVTITSNTTEVYLMPDNTLYWYGYEGDNYQTCNSANGWSLSGLTFEDVTKSTNYIDLNSSANLKVSGIGTKNAVSATKINIIATGIAARSGIYGDVSTSASKDITYRTAVINLDSSNIKYYSTSISGNNYLAVVGYTYTNKCESLIHAMWYE